ncbi:hypothetical protein DFP94_101530 [Fontibacillus phaseoli]|uniref:Uncharacterized protein n=1 Tax=Fontibacillus phaseoli TaxID=1416533 RepID=A0A369BNH4_9BACL|nr:hypothetical protein [Fontibacillus phaseoli]RCX22941.1 hypothetical protein DFP94_101530 [Fontibacillus phaseoli]
MAQKLRELNVKVDVDIAEAIRGLKAIQREAKKATQALRELETESGANRTFNKGDIAHWDGIAHVVICADSDTAVLAPKTDRTTDYTRLFAVDNTPELFSAIEAHLREVSGE